MNRAEKEKKEKRCSAQSERKQIAETFIVAQCAKALPTATEKSEKGGKERRGRRGREEDTLVAIP